MKSLILRTKVGSQFRAIFTQSCPIWHPPRPRGQRQPNKIRKKMHQIPHAPNRQAFWALGKELDSGILIPSRLFNFPLPSPRSSPSPALAQPLAQRGWAVLKKQKKNLPP